MVLYEPSKWGMAKAQFMSYLCGKSSDKPSSSPSYINRWYLEKLILWLALNLSSFFFFFLAIMLVLFPWLSYLSANSTIVPLFEKVLSASDAGRIGRLVLPKACAEVTFKFPSFCWFYRRWYLPPTYYMLFVHWLSSWQHWLTVDFMLFEKL